MATLLVSCQNNRNPLPEIARDRSHNLYHLLHGVIVCWIDPPGHGLDKVGKALAKTGGILLFGIEGVLFNRKILPFPVFRNGPSELYET